MSIISSLSSIANSTQSGVVKANTKLQNAIANLVGGNSATKDDVASVSLALQLQSQVSNVKQVSNNLAQASSLAEVAAGGIAQIKDITVQLQNLAVQARSGTLTDANRADLNKQFQSLSAAIDTIASNTSFGGKKLLDGSVSGDNAVSFASLFSAGGSGEDSGGLSIRNQSAKDLLGSTPLNLLSTEGADAAFNATTQALASINETQAQVGDFQQAVGYASANVDSALFNQDAARAFLNEADFAEGATGFSIANLQLNAATTLAAQSNRLPPSMLELLK
jgi:flagellin